MPPRIVHMLSSMHCIISLFIIDGHLDHFQLLAIMNNSAVNICIQIYVWTHVSFGKYPGVDCRVIFLRICLFFKVVV